MNLDAEKRDAAAGSPWALSFESVSWDAASEAEMSRRQRLIARGGFESAIPPRIAELDVVLDPAVAAESVEASLAIARFDEEMSRRLDMAEGEELSPLDAVLLRTESASSSQIEQITANARSLALASIGEDTGPNARLVVSNSNSMRAALAMAEDMDITTIIDAHSALLGDSAPHHSGQFRDDPVWIGGSGSTPHTADFVPPRAERVSGLMEDLVEFARRVDVAPLSHAALAHAQFETIHPFPDGNGRVGRVLVQAMLRDAQVTRRMTLPVSSGLLADIDGYYEALNSYRAGDLDAIVAEFSQASFRSINNGRALVDDLAATYEGWRERIRARSDAAVWRALPVVISQPAVTIAYLAERMSISVTAAERAIHQMAAAEVLVPLNARRRNRVWTSPEVTGALDDFAERAGRRTFRRG